MPIATIELDLDDHAIGLRLVDFAKAHLVVVPNDAIGPLIASGALTIGARVGKIADPVRGGDVVGVSLAALAAIAFVPEPPAIVPLAIAYEDDDLLVVDKPAGMHVHPLGAYRTGTLINALLHHAGARVDQPWAPWRPHPVHRLDRAASGLLVIAKRAEIAEALRTKFAPDAVLGEHAIDRRYRATVIGHIGDAAHDAGTIDAPLGRDPTLDYRRAVVAIADGGEVAITHYRVVARIGPDADHPEARTELELTLATGRTHQIRAHLASLGHPIVGDALYATGARDSNAIALRANELRFRHPRTDEPLVIVV